MSQGQLARRVGTSASAVSSVERGERNITMSSCEAFVRALACEPAALFTDMKIKSRPRPASRAWVQLSERLRDQPEEYLRTVQELVVALDRGIARSQRQP